MIVFRSVTFGVVVVAAADEDVVVVFVAVVWCSVFLLLRSWMELNRRAQLRSGKNVKVECFVKRNLSKQVTLQSADRSMCTSQRRK